MPFGSQSHPTSSSVLILATQQCFPTSLLLASYHPACPHPVPCIGLLMDPPRGSTWYFVESRRAWQQACIGSHPSQTQAPSLFPVAAHTTAYHVAQRTQDFPLGHLGTHRAAATACKHVNKRQECVSQGHASLAAVDTSSWVQQRSVMGLSSGCHVHSPALITQHH